MAQVIWLVIISILCIVVGLLLSGWLDSKGKKRTSSFFLAIVVAIVWIILMICINFGFTGIFSSAHNAKHGFTELSVCISLISYFVVDIFFNAPNFFGELRGYQMTERSKYIKPTLQLAIASFPAAFFWWENGKEDDFIDFFGELALIMAFGVIIIGVCSFLLSRNTVRDIFFKKDNIITYFQNKSFKLSENAQFVLEKIGKQGFVSFSDDKTIELGLSDLMSYGVPIEVYEVNCKKLYTLGDIRCMVPEMKPKTKFYKLGNLMEAQHCNVQFKNDVIEKVQLRTGANQKSINNYLSKILFHDC